VGSPHDANKTSATTLVEKKIRWKMFMGSIRFVKNAERTN